MTEISTEAVTKFRTFLEQAYSLTWRITNLVAGSTKSIDVRVQWNEPNRPTRTYALATVRFNY